MAASAIVSSQMFPQFFKWTFLKNIGDGATSGPLKNANTTRDGSSGTMNDLYTSPTAAPGGNGTRVKKIRAIPVGDNVATVLRVFINDGTAGADHTSLIGELSLPETTGTETSGQTAQYFQCDADLPPGYKLQVTLGTAVASGWKISCEAGDY